MANRFTPSPRPAPGRTPGHVVGRGISFGDWKSTVTTIALAAIARIYLTG